MRVVLRGLVFAALCSVPASAATIELAPPVGLTFENVVRGRYRTLVVREGEQLTQVIDTGLRDVGKVVEKGDGEVKIGVQAVEEKMKVNDREVPGGVPDSGETHLRIYATDGRLLRTYPAGILVPGDVRDLAVQLPKGELHKGMRWRQRFQLGVADEALVPVDAAFELAGARKVMGRSAYVIRGKLKMAPKKSPRGYLSATGQGEAEVHVDAKTGMLLYKSVKLEFQQVREDPLSLAYEKSLGKKLGIYIELVRQEKIAYLGTGVPPGLAR